MEKLIRKAILVSLSTLDAQSLTGIHDFCIGYLQRRQSVSREAVKKEVSSLLERKVLSYDPISNKYDIA